MRAILTSPALLTLDGQPFAPAHEKDFAGAHDALLIHARLPSSLHWQAYATLLRCL